jgi:integrase
VQRSGEADRAAHDPGLPGAARSQDQAGRREAPAPQVHPPALDRFYTALRKTGILRKPGTPLSASRLRDVHAVISGALALAALFLRLEATTGLRPGEVCALWWQDFDLETGDMIVGHNIVHARGLPDGYVRKRTKSRHGDDRPNAALQVTVETSHGHWLVSLTVRHVWVCDGRFVAVRSGAWPLPRSLPSSYSNLCFE